MGKGNMIGGNKRINHTNAKCNHIKKLQHFYTFDHTKNKTFDHTKIKPMYKWCKGDKKNPIKGQNDLLSFSCKPLDKNCVDNLFQIPAAHNLNFHILKP